MTNKSLLVLIYSYKGKFLKNVLESINNNTSNDFTVLVIDQHPLIRIKNVLPESERFFYRHIFWDFIDSPCAYKANEIELAKSEYIAIVSDDVLLTPGWDEKLMQFIDGRDIVVSGSGQRNVIHKDKYFLGIESFPSDAFNLTQYVDRNFIFAKRELFITAGYPTFIKYHGEEELLSLKFFKQGTDIWSAPSNLYSDYRLRPIENLYCPYSITHNYNAAIDLIRSGVGSENGKRTTDEFLEFHRIKIDELKKLPFPNQDVEYDPNKMAFQQVDARKFAAVTKAIY